MGAMTDEIMTLREVAEFLKVNERAIYRLVADGRIPASKVGEACRLRHLEIEEWITPHTRGESRTIPTVKRNSRAYPPVLTTKGRVTLANAAYFRQH